MNEYLSQYDINLIRAWVEQSHGSRCDIPNWLTHWKEAKSKYLFKLLGDKTSITYNYHYQITKEDLINSIENNRIIRNLIDEISTSAYDILTVVSQCTNWGAEWARRNQIVKTPFIEPEFYHNLSYRVYDSMNFATIVEGTSNFDSRFLSTLNFDNIKITIHEKERWHKVLRKLLNFIEKIFNSEAAAEVPEEKKKIVFANIAKIRNLIEPLQNALSVILNSAQINSADLVLSVHPLDYLTMSNNDCGWTSCMSWYDGDNCDEAGCYHAGTVEMMNSDSVIVAHLDSSEPMVRDLWYGSDAEWAWNNKRWRCLFIVNEGFICGVKEYPYHDEALLHTALNNIAALAQENLGWTYNTEILSKEKAKRPDGKSQSFYTHLMYKDINSSNIPAIRYSNKPQVIENTDCAWDYSGVAYCPICGNELTCHELSCCVNCSDYTICECCGEYFNSDCEGYAGNGLCICQNCLENEYTHCDGCEYLVYGDDAIIFEMSYVYRGEIPYRQNRPFYHESTHCPSCAKELLNLYKEYFITNADNTVYTLDAKSIESEETLECIFDEVFPQFPYRLCEIELD